jgi:hypothetical protein
VRPVVALVFHAAAPHDAGPLVRALAEARHALAERQRIAFLAAGADAAEIVAGSPDGLSFGERLVAAIRAPGGEPNTRRGATGPLVGGAIVLGSGSIPLARAADMRRFVEVAAGPGGHALANNFYSADAIAISRAADLLELPPLPADNALPRWLAERKGVAVADLRFRWRLGVDIDTPLDLIVLGDPAGHGFHPSLPLFGEGLGEGLGERLGEGLGEGLGERLAALADVLTNRRAEVLVAGRVSTAILRWLDSGVACRVRALVEERGLRAATQLAQFGATTDSRPPRSILGELLDRDGPDALAETVARLADAAVIDTRVLLAHRHGFAESAWPAAEDRFASDLLAPASIADPWLRALTESAMAPSAGRPIILGGHTMVNGGLRLLAGRARAGGR